MTTPTKIAQLIQTADFGNHVALVLRPHEADKAPNPDDYRIGTFVKIPIGKDGGVDYIIGVVNNVKATNPNYAYLNAGLRTSDKTKTFFAEGYDENITTLDIFPVGVKRDGSIAQGLPDYTPRVDSSVYLMTDPEVKEFHETDAGFAIAYVASLRQASPTDVHPEFVVKLLRRVSNLFPDQKPLLENLERSLKWELAAGRDA